MVPSSFLPLLLLFVPFSPSHPIRKSSNFISYNPPSAQRPPDSFSFSLISCSSPSNVPLAPVYSFLFLQLIFVFLLSFYGFFSSSTFPLLPLTSSSYSLSSSSFSSSSPSSPTSPTTSSSSVATTSYFSFSCITHDNTTKLLS